MNPQQFYDTYHDQSLLYNQKDTSLRGQCVQAVCFYVVANNKPVIWADAYQWYASNQFPDQYDRIANTPNAVPQPGDIIVWLPSLPGSGGAGHIAVCERSLPGTGTFISIDSNWGGKTVHRVTHNYNYVCGWLRFKNASPAPQPTTQGADEVIQNADQATKLYKMLRVNGGASDAEINGTVGRRTFANFVNDAQPEVAQRDEAFRNQAAQLAVMQATINQLNQTVTNVTSDDQADKQKLADALAKIGDLTSQLETAHDQLADAQKVLTTPTPVEPDVPLITRIIAALLRRNKD